MPTNSITHTASLPYGYRAEFAWSPEGRFRVEWDPDVPNIRSARHRKKFFQAYTRARRDFMRDVATVIGGSVGIVDVPGAVTDGSFAFEAVKPATKH